jgi:rod shape-determining protein MreC
MRAIFNFLFRLRLFFLLIVLQTISGALIVKQHHYHRAAFLNTSNAISGQFYQKIANARYFLNLREVNRSLATENARLRAALSLGNLDSISLIDLKDSLLGGDSDYTYHTARVINSTVTYRNNYITINRGRLHGIEPRMAVISDQGVVGIVKDVSEHFATVISILNKNARISAKLPKSGTTGTVIWPGGAYQLARLIEIPIHVDVAIGDTVTTSPFSNIFPDNLYVGTVSSINVPEGASTYQITIELGHNYKLMPFVTIIGHKLQEERMELESGLNYGD